MDSRSPASSPTQVTPDDITAFTPSSANRPDLKSRSSKNREIVPETSSPTPVTADKQEDADDDIAKVKLFDLGDLLKKGLDEEDRRNTIEERRKALALLKQTQLRQQKWGGKAKAGNESEDELSITPKAEPTVRFADIKPAHAQRTARSVLANFKPSDSSSKSRQTVLKFAGKHAGVKEELTETMVDFAGKTFKHANLRTTNGGARPAGQKANREHLITQNHLNALTLAGHLKQAVSLREQKELLFKVKKRNLPPREAEKLDGLIQALVEREKAGASWESDKDEEEEEEDDDFQPSGSDEDGEIEGEGTDDNDDALQYSGDEEEGGAVPEVQVGEEEVSEDAGAEDLEDDVSMDDDQDADKENEPTPTAKDRKGKAPERPAHVSSPSQRQPLVEVQTARSATPPPAMPSTLVDISGFGSGGGSPGFSQLFEATQAAGPSMTAVRSIPTNEAVETDSAGCVCRSA